MSWAATAWAERVKTGSPATKLVLLTLANFADDEGYCFPSQKTLSEITECGERSIRRYLDHLEQMGALRRVRRHRDDGSKTSDGVFLMIKVLPAMLAAGQSDRRPDGADPTGQAVAGHEPPDKQSDRKEEARAPKPVFNTTNGRVEGLPEPLIEKWREAYPAIDVAEQIAKAEAWLLTNPRNRKSDYVRFLNGWLSRAQDKAPRASGQNLRPSAHTKFQEKRYVGTNDSEIDWLNNSELR